MSKAKKQIYDMINKKAKKYKELRTNSERSMSPKQIVLRYVEAVEEVKKSSDDIWDFKSGLEKVTMLMENRLRAFDSHVHIDVQWNGGMEQWGDLQVLGLNIAWSDEWANNNPGQEQQQAIDIGHLLLEGLFD